MKQILISALMVAAVVAVLNRVAQGRKLLGTDPAPAKS